jgi:putative tricarboxylic transport membrane protein
VKYWREALAKMVKTETWKKVLAEQSWTPAYMDAPEFKAFLDKVNQEYKEIFEELGILAK